MRLAEIRLARRNWLLDLARWPRLPRSAPLYRLVPDRKRCPRQGCKARELGQARGYSPQPRSVLRFRDVSGPAWPELQFALPEALKALLTASRGPRQGAKGYKPGCRR